MFQTKVVEKIKTHISRSVIFFSENPAIYETMWKNSAELGRPQMTISHMLIACSIPKPPVTQDQAHCCVFSISSVEASVCATACFLGGKKI